MANHQALLQPSAGGTSVCFKAAVAIGGESTKRSVWLSARFLAEHPELAASLRRAFFLPCSGWREVTQPQYAALVHKNSRLPQRQRRGLQQVGILAESQAAGIAEDSELRLFTPSTFVDKFVVYSSAWSGVGACGTSVQ